MLRKECRRVEGVVECRRRPCPIHVALECDAHDAGLCTDLPSVGSFAEDRLAALAVVCAPEGQLAHLRRRGRAHCEYRVADEESCDRSHVSAARPHALREGRATGTRTGGQRGVTECAAGAILDHDASGREHRVAARARPEHAGSEHATLVSREIGPAVVIKVEASLPVRAREQRVAPRRRQSARVPIHRVAAVARRLVEEQLALGLRNGAPRHEIDHAAQCRGPVHGRRCALDDLDLAEVHRRDLEQAQSLG